MKDFTNNKHDEYFDSPRTCSSHASYSCYNSYVWWFNSCGDRESVKEYCSNGCSGTSCNSEYPKTVSRLSHSFKAYDQQEEAALKDFLGIDPQGVDIDTYLSGLSNNALDDWRDHWINKWNSLNNPNKNSLKSFTNDEHDLYYDAVRSCTDRAYFSCYNGYVWWFDSCGDRTSIKDRCSDGCSGDSCVINSDCPSGWVSWGDSCYKSFGSHDWLSGKSICEGVNAHLVTIDSSAENDWVHELFGSAWIGFNDRSSEGVWVWTNGYSSFVRWGGGEPNDAGGEDCAVYRGDGAWNDWSCGHSAVVVCEFDGVPVNNDGVQGDCGDGWTQFNGHCYRVERGSWVELSDKCAALGGYLVNINSLAENDWVLSFSGDANSWIGYSDRSSEGVWVWTDGSSYSKWHGGEPNDCCGGEDCAQFWADGDWNDAKCGQVHNGVCEKLVDCDDGDDCTSDFYSGGCRHEPVLNCHGDGVCDSGEDYCNSPSDCEAPVCDGLCMSVSCDSGVPVCVKEPDCCGNGVCDLDESCGSCSVDCNCRLGVDLSSVNCVSDGVSCSGVVIDSSSVLTASFSLVNRSGHSVSVVFNTLGGLSLGSLVVDSDLVTKSFVLPVGRQLVVVSGSDLVDGDVFNSVLFSLNVVGGGDGSFNYSNIIYPFNYSAGLSDGVPFSAGEFPVSGDGQLLGLMGFSALAGVSAVALSKKWRGVDQGTYVPSINELSNPDQKLDISDSVFNGLAGVSNDKVSSFINNAKLVISAGQLLIPIGAALTASGVGAPVGAVLMAIGGACAVIDNVNDITEFFASSAGAIKAHLNNDISLRNEYLINAGFDLFAVVPLIGDLAQDGRRAAKVAGVVGDGVQAARKSVKIADDLIDLAVKSKKFTDAQLIFLTRTLKSVKNLDDYESVVKKIIKESSEESLENGLSIIKKLGKLSDVNASNLWRVVKGVDFGDNAKFVSKLISNADDDVAKVTTRIVKKMIDNPLVFKLNDSLVINKKSLNVIDKTISYSKDSLDSLKKLYKKLGKEFNPPKDFKLTKDLAGFGFNNKGHIEIDLVKLVSNFEKKGSDAIYELVNHEILHQITDDFSKEIKDILGDSYEKYIANGFNIGRNEAHDLLVRRLAELSGSINGKRFKSVFDNRLKKLIDPFVNSIPKKLTRDNASDVLDSLTSMHTANLGRLDSAPIIAEQIIIEGKNSKTLKLLEDLKNKAKLLGDDGEKIVNKINEIFDLKDKYKQVVGLIG